MPPLLTETAVKAVKSEQKARKIYDERGLFLFVPPTGARLWRMKYKFGGRQELLALGEWPHTSLKCARGRRDEAHRLLADGIDPAAKKKAERAAIADTFPALAREYLDTKRDSFNPKTLSKAEWLLDGWLNKYVGKTPVRQLTAGDILSVCRRIEAKRQYETAHRARALANRVMRYGVITGRVERDPCADLRGALVPVKTKNLIWVQSSLFANYSLLQKLDLSRAAMYAVGMDEVESSGSPPPKRKTIRNGFAVSERPNE